MPIVIGGLPEGAYRCLLIPASSWLFPEHKGDKLLYVPLGVDLQRAMDLFLGKAVAVFGPAPGKPFTPATWQRMIRRSLEAVGYSHGEIHHCFADFLVENYGAVLMNGELVRFDQMLDNSWKTLGYPDPTMNS